MDKIDVGSYFDYTISDHTAATVSNWSVTEIIHLPAPSPQLVNFLKTKGWTHTAWYLTDPTAITDYAYMQKEQFDPELVLQALVDEFNTLYNEGRTLNDDRFDDIMAVWTSCLDKTEDELNDMEDDEDIYESSIEAFVNNAIQSDYTTHAVDVDGFLDDWGDSERSRIDDAFDAKEDELQQSMVDRGIYNTTTWDSISAGLTREESDADTELEDKITQRQLELKEKTYDDLVDMRKRFMDANHRLMNELHGQREKRIALHNKVIEALNAFAERRTDEYPSFVEPMNAALSIAVGQRSQGWT